MAQWLWQLQSDTLAVAVFFFFSPISPSRFSSICNETSIIVILYLITLVLHVGNIAARNPIRLLALVFVTSAKSNSLNI